MIIFSRFFILLFFLLPAGLLKAQHHHWQQKAEYTMNIGFDVKKHQFEGYQKLVYHNNSPEKLDRAFYHLYYNAFQPGSMMDVRSMTISDPDYKVGNRIYRLKEDEIGFHKVKSLKCNGKDVDFEVVGTILEVDLSDPILPGEQAIFEMEFFSQVPVQIRRTGRDNDEGIEYSMSQWYPKMCEYDYQGWHANPYIAREFYGVWGDFDIKITIDKDYVIGGTGYLQNPEEIGYGYEEKGQKVKRPKGETLTWHFKAPNVHDFVWAADPDYTHTTYQAENGPLMHFFFQKNDRTEDPWKRLPKVMSEVFAFINKKYGEYPYDQYSFIQGGDGGMEYPMATLITGERSYGSLVGVSIHELMHSWYQMILGTNESLFSWMDEGFTSYATAEVKNYLKSKRILSGRPSNNPQRGTYAMYLNFARTNMEEPLSTHADHFVTNRAYWTGAYNKGAVFLQQMKYIVGKENFDAGMLQYYNTWKFKHPEANDFIRIMEKQSGLELDWYKQYFVYTTHTIDYGIREVEGKDNETVVLLEKVGVMPMPLDVYITYKDGSKEVVNIPLRIMRGAKPQEERDFKYSVKEDWPWTHPLYELILPVPLDQILEIVIDETGRLADVDRENNRFAEEERK